MGRKKVIQLETTAEHDVKELIAQRVEKAVQEVVDKCSKDYFRTIKVSIDVEVE